MTNCPNCAAPIDGLTCKYCGTTVYDCTEIDLHNPQWFRFKFGGSTFVGKFYIGNAAINLQNIYDVHSARNILGEFVRSDHSRVIREIDMHLIEV